MQYTKIIVDWTNKVGCPDCKLFRHSHRNDGKHWQTCKQHRKCVEIQHLAHQQELEDSSITYLDPSAQEHLRRLAEIETEDGSLERELHKVSENRNTSEHNLFHEIGITPLSCTDITHVHCMDIQTQHANKKNIITKTNTDPNVLAVLLPMCAIARAACSGKRPRGAS